MPIPKANIVNYAKSRREWTNADNRLFYEALSITDMRTQATLSGLDSVCDMDVLRSYWQQADSILEIGAGYGRVLEYLRAQGFQGRVTAIENNRYHYQYLKEQYAIFVELLQGNICSMKFLSKQYTLILWLWAGIMDFTPREQPGIFQQFRQLLAKGGRLIVDTTQIAVLPIGGISQKYGTGFPLVINAASHHAYSPSPTEIESYASAAGMSVQSCLPYQTATGVQRFLHIIG